MSAITLHNINYCQNDTLTNTVKVLSIILYYLLVFTKCQDSSHNSDMSTIKYRKRKSHNCSPLSDRIVLEALKYEVYL